MLENTERNKTLSIHWKEAVLPIHYLDFGEGPVLLFLHGWGHNKEAFLPIIELFPERYKHISIDFPGFGESERPADTWGVHDYAECISLFLTALKIESCIVIGHSFGGRVAFRLANGWPKKVRGLFLIASAGIRNKAPFIRQIRIKTIRTLARTAQRCIPGSLGKRIKQSLYDKIASRDYKQAGAMRDILVKVINDDVSDLLPNIQHPVTLLYGSDDIETKPELGKRMHSLLPNAKYIEIPGFDHYTILTRGRHQAGHQLGNFINDLQTT